MEPKSRNRVGNKTNIMRQLEKQLKNAGIDFPAQKNGAESEWEFEAEVKDIDQLKACLLYTSDAADD